jgi:hypothetical protein
MNPRWKSDLAKTAVFAIKYLLPLAAVFVFLSILSTLLLPRVPTLAWALPCAAVAWLIAEKVLGKDS